MTIIKYIHGDATDPIGDGNKLLIHVCNTVEYICRYLFKHEGFFGFV